ncbi:hypothetical protein KAT36_04900, partial [Candidatus Pacearchaeota archaeon]|nr:hypothetical protein [Candidatus Pacearchaeota archaeon]
MVVLLHPHRLICNPGWGKLRSSFAFMILLVIMTSFVLAIDIDFDCPDEIYVNEEFECELEIGAGDGEYDVKVDLDGERDSALRIWDGEVWKSGYYYLLEFIGNGDKKNVMLKVLETGRYEGVLKLRQGDKRESFDINMKVRPEAV